MFNVNKEVETDFKILVGNKVLNLTHSKLVDSLEKKVHPINLALKKKNKFDYSLIGSNPSSSICVKRSFFLYKCSCKNYFLKKNKLILKQVYGFSNLFLNKPLIYGLTGNGFNLRFKKRRVVIDSSSPNIGKVMHIGHFRSIVQGFFVKNIFILSRSYIIMNNHCGSWGSHAGLSTAYLRSQYGRNSFLVKNIRTLSSSYSGFHQAFSKYKSLGLSNKISLKALHSLDKKMYFLWKNVFIKSTVHFSNIFKKFKFLYDLNLGEYFFKRSLVSTANSNLFSYTLVSSSTVFIVKNLLKGSFQTMTLKTSRSSTSYLFFDIANVYFQMQHNGSDSFIYVTDDRQALHFISAVQVVFKLSRALKFKKLHFSNVFFGTVCGFDKKPIKSRLGVNRYSTLSHLITTSSSGLSTKDNPLNFFLKKGWVSASLGYSDLKANRFSNISNNNINLIKSYAEVAYLRFFLLKLTNLPCCKHSGITTDINLYAYLVKYLNESVHYLKLSFIKKSLSHLFSYVHSLSSVSHKIFFKKKFMGHARKNLLLMKESSVLRVKKTFVKSLTLYLSLFAVTF